MALLIVLAGALAYANSLQGPFIFDDRPAIIDNVSIRSFSTAWHPDRQTPVAGRPIANLSFAINYALGGHSVEGYHVANVAIHVLAALALFGVLRRLFSAGAQPVATGETADVLACVSAMAWLLHPLNTEAVNYVTQRTESLEGLFFLTTVYAAVRSWDARPRSHWELVAVVANVCGVMTKESMIVAPVVIVLCDRVFAFSGFRDAFARRRFFYAGLAAGWVVFLLLASGTPFFSPKGFATHVSRWTYLLNQAPLVVRYLRLSLWPQGLVVDYGVPEALSLMDVWPSAVFVSALVVLTMVALVRLPVVGFWAAWFFITLAPASSVISIPTEVGAERRMYLPLVAVIVLVVAAARQVAFVRRSALPVAAVVLAGLGSATVVRNAEYRDGVTIWQTVVERRPHARAHANLAAELREHGRVEESIAHLRIAAPLDANAKHALGSALLERGELAEGVVHLQEFVEKYPEDLELASAREELASGLYRLDRLPEAISQYQAVVSAAPDYASGRLNLANLLLSSNRFVDAAAEYRQVLRLQPRNVFAQAHLGLALSASGALDQAIDVFRAVLASDAGEMTATRGLVDVLLRQQRFTDAEHEARRATAVNPRDPSAHSLLGVVLASSGRRADAMAAFEAAIRLDPQQREAQDALTRLRQQPGEQRR